MGRQINNRLWTQAVSVLLVLMVIVVWLIYTETKPTDRNQLKIEVGQLGSHAAEGRLLAEQASAGRITQTFFQTHAYFLVDKTNSAKNSLDSANIEPGLEVAHWQSRHLATQLKRSLEMLSSSYGNPTIASTLKNNLTELSVQLKQVENGLRQ